MPLGILVFTGGRYFQQNFHRESYDEGRGSEREVPVVQEAGRQASSWHPSQADAVQRVQEVSEEVPPECGKMYHGTASPPLLLALP